MYKQKQGFTLVELIVVITILAILGTIAFMAFAGYSKNSRDSVRATDLSAIKTSLELFQMKAGFLPDPSGAEQMTYSGGSMTVWNQGTFGDSVMQNVEKLSTKPVDPLFGTEYTYSITNGKNEFEIGGVVEGDSQVSGNFLFNQANAQNVIQQALIQGNYNGKVLKVEMGGILYIFALPSIITSDLSTVDVETLVLNKLLSYNGYGTIPASFSGTTTSTAESFDFGGVGTNVVVFSGSIDDLQDINNLRTFTLNLQNAYSGSVLVNNQDYATLMAIDPDSDDLINSEIAYLINNNLGGDITADTVDLSGEGSGGGGGSSIPNLFTYSSGMNLVMDCSVSSTLCSTGTSGWIFGITQDNDGVIWFTTDKGVVSYDGTNYTLFNDATIGSSVGRIKYDSSRDLLWITGDTGIITYNGTTWTVYNNSNTSGVLPADSYMGIFIDNSNNVWVSSSNNGLVKYNGTSWTVYNSANTSSILNNMMGVGMTQDVSGNIWVGHGTGSSYFNGTTWSGITGAPFNSPGILNGSAMYKDSTGKIWLNDNVTLKSYDGTNVVSYTPSGLFPIQYGFAEDSLGNLYVAGQDKLLKYDGSAWTNMSTQALMGNSSNQAGVRSVFKDANGQIWLGTGYHYTDKQGLYMYKE